MNLKKLTEHYKTALPVWYFVDQTGEAQKVQKSETKIKELLDTELYF